LAEMISQRMYLIFYQQYTNAIIIVVISIMVSITNFNF